MFDLKPLSVEAIPQAISKAERYRLLNEPRDAESICRDILRADPEHREAVVVLLLSLTDQFGHGHKVSINHAEELLARLDDDYQRAYYAGVICERWAKSQMEESIPGYAVFGWLHKAMGHYAAALDLRPAGNDDAVLRWNACARIIKRHDGIRPKKQDVSISSGFDDEVPV